MNTTEIQLIKSIITEIFPSNFELNKKYTKGIREKTKWSRDRLTGHPYSTVLPAVGSPWISAVAALSLWLWKLYWVIRLHCQYYCFFRLCDAAVFLKKSHTFFRHKICARAHITTTFDTLYVISQVRLHEQRLTFRVRRPPDGLSRLWGDQWFNTRRKP